MKTIVHITIDDHALMQNDGNLMPLLAHVDGKVYSSEALRNLFDLAHEYPESYEFVMTPEVQVRFKTEVIPQLFASSSHPTFRPLPVTFLSPNSRYLDGDSSELNVDVFDQRVDYLSSFFEFMAETFQCDLSPQAIYKLRQTCSNNSYPRELLRRKADQGISDLFLKAHQRLNSFRFGFLFVRGAAHFMNNYNEGQGVLTALGNASYVCAASYLQENYVTIKGGLKIVTGYALTKLPLAIKLTKYGAKYGIKWGGGLVTFVASEIGEYVFVQYLWSPMVEAIPSYLSSVSARALPPQELRSHNKSLSLDLPQITELYDTSTSHVYQPTARSMSTITPSQLAAARLLLKYRSNTQQMAEPPDWIANACLPRQVTLFPSRPSLALDTRLLPQQSLHDPHQTGVSKQAIFQQALKKQWDYSNPERDFSRYIRATLAIDPNRLLGRNNPLQADTRATPQVSFSLDNHSGRTRYQFTVDPVRQPKLAGGFFVFHLMKNIWQWYRLPATEKCYGRIQSTTRHCLELKQNTLISYNTLLWLRRYDQQAILAKHRDNLTNYINEYASLHADNLSITYISKVMHYFNQIGDYDSLKILTDRQADEHAVRTVVERYHDRFQESISTVLNALNQSQSQRVERENEALQKLFAHEPLTHAIDGAIYYKQEQYQQGIHAFDRAKTMAEQELSLTKKQYPHDSYYTSDGQRHTLDVEDITYIDPKFQGIQDAVRAKRAILSQIHEMQLNLDKQAYFENQGLVRKEFLGRWEQGLVNKLNNKYCSITDKAELAQVYYLQSRFDEAIETYREINQGHYVSPEIKFKLGLLLHQEGHYQEAKQCLLDFQRQAKPHQYPDKDKEAYLAGSLIKSILIDEYRQTKDNLLIEPIIEQVKIIAVSPLASREQRFEEICFIASCDKAEDALALASTLYQSLGELNNDNRELQVNLHQLMGTMCFKLQQFAEALNHFSQALIERPEDSDLLASLGFARLCQGDTVGARRAFEYALTCDSQHAQAISGIQTIKAAQLIPTCLEAAWTAADWTLNAALANIDPAWYKVKASIAGVKILLGSGLLLTSIKDFFSGTTEKTFSTILSSVENKLKARLPQLFATNAENKVGFCTRLVGGNAMRLMDSAMVIGSSLLLFDRYIYPIIGNDAHAMKIYGGVSSLSIIHTLDQMTKGVDAASSMAQVFGLEQSNQIVTFDGGLFIAARCFDLSELVLLYNNYTIADNAYYHMMKQAVQGASIGYAVTVIAGKVTAAAAAALSKSSVTLEPTTITATVATVSIGSAFYYTYNYYQDSQQNAMLSNALVKLECKDFDGAEKKIEEYYLLNPNDQQVKATRWRILSFIHSHRGCLDDAVKCGNEYLLLSPKDAETFRKEYLTKILSLLHASKGEFEAAVHFGNEYISAQPKDAAKFREDFFFDIYANRCLLLAQKNPAQALEDFQSFKKMHPEMIDDRSVNNKLALAFYISQEDYREALTHLDFCLQVDSQNQDEFKQKRYDLSRIWVGQATLNAYADNNLEFLETVYQEHLEHYPDDHDVKEQLTRLQYQVPFAQGNYVKAIADCSQVLQLTLTPNEHALRCRGRSYLALQNLSAAENDFKTLTNLNPNDHDALFYQGAIQAQRGYLGIPQRLVSQAITALQQEEQANHDVLMHYQTLQSSLQKKVREVENITLATTVSALINASIHYVSGRCVSTSSLSSRPCFFSTTAVPHITIRSQSQHTINHKR